MRRIDRSKPPTGPWTLNKDSEQAQGLVLYLPRGAGGGFVPDFSGTAAHGTATAIKGARSRTGAEALEFDGSTSGIDCGTNAALNPSSISVVAWIDPSSLGNAYNTVVSKNGVGYHQLFVKSNGKLAVYVHANIDVDYDGTGTYTVGTNAATLVAFSYAPSALVGYVNGVVDSTVVGSANSLTSNSGATTIGYDTGTAGRVFAGSISHVRIYNRALTAAQHWAQFDPSTRFELMYPLRDRKWISIGSGASTITAAAGVATTSTLTGSSTAAGSVTASAGVATDSTLTGKSTAAATLTAAAGVATDSTLTGSSTAAATITAAAGVATTSALSSGSGSGVTAAAGVATTSTLTGSSVAAAAVTAAAGVATGATLTGSVGSPIITPAAGVATGAVLAGSSVAVASMVAAAGVATASTVSSVAPAGTTGAVILLPIRLISGIYTTTGVTAGRALQNLRAFLPHSSVEVVPGQKVNPQWYRFFQMFVDVFIGGAGAYTLQDILNFVETSQANATQQALLTSAIGQQLQGVAEATAVVKQVAISNSLSGSDQIPDVPLSYGMEP